MLWEGWPGGLCSPQAVVLRLQEWQQTHGIMQNTCHGLWFCRTMERLIPEPLHPPLTLEPWRQMSSIFTLPAPCRGVEFLLLLLPLLGKEAEERPPAAPQDPNGTVTLPSDPSHSPACRHDLHLASARKEKLRLKKRAAELYVAAAEASELQAGRCSTLFGKEETERGEWQQKGEVWKKCFGFGGTLILKILAAWLKKCLFRNFWKNKIVKLLIAT